ncbi:MAG: aldolase [archaeon]
MKTLSASDVKVPADVPDEAKDAYVKNFLDATRNTGRLMLFAGDQKMEHLNDDFHGESSLGPIPEDDNDPEHLFRIASKGVVGVFATQLGLISLYGKDYPDVNYLVKLNSKTHLVKTERQDPISRQLWGVEQVADFKRSSGLNVVGVGYTIYLGSEFESEMLMEAAQIVQESHQHGLLVVFWIYPRGQGVEDEKDPHLIAGATGAASCLGVDFVKVNYPKKEGEKREESFKEAVAAGGRTRVICAGGSSTDAEKFLDQLHKQIHIAGAQGNATGRNVHQKSLSEAIRMCDAISAITFGDKDVAYALKVYEGKEDYRL